MKMKILAARLTITMAALSHGVAYAGSDSAVPQSTAVAKSASASGLSPEAIAQQYCDDTWDAVLTVAVKPDDPDIARAEAIVVRLATALNKGPWKVVVFSYPKMWPVMALTGNRILVSKEFMDDSDDNELGFVFGHEMGHVILGHLKQRYAALIADAGGNVTNWKQVTKFAKQEWPLYRQEEYQADKFGFNLAAKAGFDAKAGAYTALSHLDEDPQHPAPDDRIAALSIRAAH